MRAWCNIKKEPQYRREAFAAGLKAAGYDVSIGAPADVKAGDVFVTWNRYDVNHDIASRVERAGGRVLVAENGYLGKDAQGRQLYALAECAHNGAGRWPDRQGGNWLDETATYGARWKALGITLQPLQTCGQHILVCPNRSFGMPGFIMPTDWAAQTERQLRALTRREIRVRPHPGNWQTREKEAGYRPLAADLEGAHAVVIWASSAGVHAIAAGIQVICTARWWILKGGARSGFANLDEHVQLEREPHFERLAWAQWTVDELASGEPFKRLLQG